MISQNSCFLSTEFEIKRIFVLVSLRKINLCMLVLYRVVFYVIWIVSRKSFPSILNNHLAKTCIFFPILINNWRKRTFWKGITILKTSIFIIKENGLLLKHNFFISINQVPSWDAFMVDLNAEQLVYIVLASSVTVDANTEEKGLFMGRECLACGCQLHTTIPVFL